MTKALEFLIEEYKQKDFGDLEREAVYNYLEKFHDELSVEDIIESLTELGAAPSILYDDDGMFAIGSEGTQSISFLDKDDKDLEDELNFDGVWFLKKKDWKPTIREAIQAYFERD